MYNTLVKIRRKQSALVFFAFLIIAVLPSLIIFITTDFFDPQPIMTTPPPDALYLDITQPIEERVANLLSYMTLEEKIGQMALVEKK